MCNKRLVINSWSNEPIVLDESVNSIESIERGIEEGDYWVPAIKDIELYIDGVFYKRYSGEE